MSIIHDALKKVQQGLKLKTDETPSDAPAAAPGASGYIYENAPAVETLPQAGQQSTDQQPPLKNKIKSMVALSCAILITGTSGLYIYQQFQNDLPKVQKFAKKSFLKLIHKEEPPDFKSIPAANLKPLAQFTINQPTMKSSSLTKPPVTLNIHGIMSNDSGNLVLINDQVYQEGDEVEGAKILKINLDSITVINNGVEQTILVKD